MTRPAPSSTSRARRADGDSTRQRLLETAGEVFAELGYSRTTSKAICARAHTHVAAVNYHFGSRDRLYESVLVEAHGRLIALDELQAIADGGAAPERQLEEVLRRVLVPGPAHTRPPWALRVLVQEMMAPTDHLPVLLREAVLPKVQVLFRIVSGVLGLPPGHPGVQRALAFTVVPAILMLVAPPPMRRTVLPTLERDPAATVDDLVAYVRAGLCALRTRHGGSGGH